MLPIDLKKWVEGYVDKNISEAMTKVDPNELTNIKIRIKELHKRIENVYKYYNKIIKDLK